MIILSVVFISNLHTFFNYGIPEHNLVFFCEQIYITFFHDPHAPNSEIQQLLMLSDNVFYELSFVYDFKELFLHEHSL